MAESTVTSAIDQTVMKIRQSYLVHPERIAILGIAGAVAVGKSRLSAQLVATLRQVSSAEIVYLPFDLWIDQENIGSDTYRGRFALSQFQDGLRAVAENQLWLCPRHDLTKAMSEEQRRELTREASEVSWNHRRFVKVGSRHHLPDLNGGSGVFVEAEKQGLYSLFLPKQSVTYVVDGTLVFASDDLKSCYDYKIFVTGSWPQRVARMIRRFNRKEVFGTTAQTEVAYVGFLVREALSCADREITQQIDSTMLIVRSRVETISNLLDVYHLLEKMQDSVYALAYALTAEAVEADALEALENLTSTADVGALLKLREELLHLVESKHLLAMRGADAVLARLADSLFK